MQLWHRRRKEGTALTQALKGRKLLLVGFTLFSMFFGAGNLIFPPDLGAKAGVNFWPAFLGCHPMPFFILFRKMEYFR